MTTLREAAEETVSGLLRRQQREIERLRALLAKTEPALMNCPVRDEVREYLKSQNG